MKARILILVLMLAFVAASGCIDDLIPEEQAASLNSSVYEFDVFYNSTQDGTVRNVTTFYLTSDGYANVVQMTKNTSVIEVIPFEDLLNPQEELITNIAVFAEVSDNTEPPISFFEQMVSSDLVEVPVVNYTIEEEVIRGQKHLYIRFEETFDGFVAYRLATPQGQDFMHVPTDSSIVRVVLPEGFTTGNPFVGKVSPQPSETYLDESGREVLVWYDLTNRPGTFLESVRQFMKVEISEADLAKETIILKFYTYSAPRMLLLGTVVLSLGVLVILGNYLSSKRRLQKVREDIERSANIRRDRK